MPVEIRELVIKTVVEEERADSETAGATQGNNMQQEMIIQTCVEKILEILKNKNER